MKLSLLLLTSSLALAATGASAQNDACTNNYGGCMERCVTRPASMQTACTQTCETNSNVCYDQLYKASSSGAQASGPVSEQRAEPDVSEARDEAKPEPKVKAKRKRH